MARARLPAVAIGFAVLGCAGCECGPQAGLVVELRSNLVAGVDVDRARTSIFPSGQRVAAFEEADEIGWGDPLERAVRLVELASLAPGDYLVVVSLERAGTNVATRTVQATVRTQTALTVLVTRDCRSVICPQGDTCIAGACAPSHCGTSGGDECPSARCAGDDECSARVACAAARCEEGSCHAFGDHTRCAAGTYCHPEEGCLPLPFLDGGPPPRDAGPECPAEGCDDGNPCTEDACGPSGCTFTANAADCDDGVYCNGTDGCGGGACSVHGGDPCPGASTCNEAARRCEGCGSDADCPARIEGVWSACTFADACTESGTRTREVTTSSCSAGTCRGTTSTETGPCTRASTEDVSCGSTSCGAFGACDWSDTCDESATQRRTCTERRCRSGSCADVATSEARACTRTTGGTDCGSSCPAYGGCEWDSECDESAERRRTCTERLCSGGTCRPRTYEQTMPCSRSTDGSACGSNPTYCGRRMDCHLCSLGSCITNRPHYDDACNPSCGVAASLCGTGAHICCGSTGGCTPVGSGPPYADCAQCCQGSTCF